MKRKSSIDILVVDDEVEIADVIAEFLRGEGYTVAVAYDGTSALECAGRLWPRLLISDVRMPRMSGYELATWVRQSITDIRAIFVSAQRQAQPPPFGVLLAKPFNFDGLLDLVQQIFKGSSGTGSYARKGGNADLAGRTPEAPGLAEASR
jgi:CheY-like chemotaxis protein